MEKKRNHSRLSTAAMKEIAAAATDEYTLIPLSDHTVEFNYQGRERMEKLLRDSGSAMVYSDYFASGDDGKPSHHPLIAYSEGGIRDDFDFGKIVMISTPLLKETVSEMTGDYEAAGWYDLRLRLSRKGKLLHIPEPLYTAYQTDAMGEKAHFAYVDPRNRASQIEMEEVATSHLAAIGALVTPDSRKHIDLSAGEFPVEASVIIPVRNRRRTIADAVKSALGQTPPFEFNVIVVDNRSTDGTGEILRGIAASDPRLHIIDTTTTPYASLGIGGCWNLAINSEKCGRYAVQLDSDDLYSRPDVLETVVRKFRDEKCGMVIGSYTLTDIEGNILPPGLIDHAEWTDKNGANNALRINGLGAPRAFYTPIAREIGFPDVSYGEDYSMGLAVSRDYRIGRIYESLYLCRRWEDNTDHALPIEKINRNNLYKDFIRTTEIETRKRRNHD